jgi:hypothetical protein
MHPHLDDNEPVDRDALAEFLRRRRESLKPAEVGLTTGVRRRTPGLRREEVAQLTGMSVDYYGRRAARSRHRRCCAPWPAHCD